MAPAPDHPPEADKELSTVVHGTVSVGGLGKQPGKAHLLRGEVDTCEIRHAGIRPLVVGLPRIGLIQGAEVPRSRALSYFSSDRTGTHAWVMKVVLLCWRSRGPEGADQRAAEGHHVGQPDAGRTAHAEEDEHHDEGQDELVADAGRRHVLKLVPGVDMASAVHRRSRVLVGVAKCAEQNMDT